MPAQLNVTQPIADGPPPVDASQVNALVSTATIQGVGSGNNEIAAAAIESGKGFGGTTGTAAPTTPALRAIGTGANDAAAGTTAGVATSLQFGSNTALA